jgi:hypothetical protein
MSRPRAFFFVPPTTRPSRRSTARGAGAARAGGDAVAFYRRWSAARLFVCVVAAVAPLIRDSRSDHARHDSFACSFCFAHGPPITRLHICYRNAAQLARPRRGPPGVVRGPPVASLFLQSERCIPALRIRKNSAATSHPTIACGFMLRTRTFPPPMRRHAACSGCPWLSRTRFVGKHRAGAPADASTCRTFG